MDTNQIDLGLLPARAASSDDNDPGSSAAGFVPMLGKACLHVLHGGSGEEQAHRSLPWPFLVRRLG
jgi:hypothetical protein